MCVCCFDVVHLHELSFVLAMTLFLIFKALGKMLQEKKRKALKKKYVVCTDVKVKLIKTHQRRMDVFSSVGVNAI